MARTAELRRPRIALLRRPDLIGALCLMASVGCSEKGNFIATEPIGSADVRIILTEGRAGPSFQVLPRTEPFVISAGALQSELENGGLPIWIFAYRLTDLADRFEGLRDVTPEELANLLRPSLEPPGAGRYEPPAPTHALQATLTEDGDRAVAYREVAWEDIRANPRTAFTVTLDGTYACPPLDRPFRIFVRGQPETACIYRRDAQCRWVSDGCRQDVAIFGVSQPTIQQDPDGTLTVGAQSCDRIDARSSGTARGETDAWRCEGRVIAAQREVLGASGEPWQLQSTAMLSSPELTQPGRWALSNAGAWYAAQGEAGDLRLRRILVEENAAPSYQPSLIPLPDDGDDRSISSTDGLRVDLTSGAFKFSVGNGEQCLRLSDSSRTSRFIAINGTSDTSLSLTPPGIGEAIALGSREWAVAGFPGQIDTSEPPGQEPIQLPAGMGAVSALSVTADRNAVVLHGTDRTVRIARVTQIFGARNLFGCPIFIPHPPGLVGPIVAAGRQHFALMTDGVLRLDADGTPLERGTVGVTYDTSFRLERRAGLDGGDLAIAYQPGERPIWVFAEGRDPFKIDLEAPILATLDGPQVILQPSANTLTVRTISDPNIFT
ncbi:MAG: hypothetical protein AAFN74_21305, partial [Myxococcota bacterium]